jgi:hypothetical protein
MGRSTYDYYPGHPIVRDPRAPPPPGWLPPPMWKPQTSLNEGKVKTLNKSKKRAFMVYEGAYKGAMEDWLTSLPKPVIDELKTKHGKELAHTGGDGYRDIATKKTLPLHKSIVGILKKHKVKPFAHSVHDSSHAIQMSFHTYHG